MHTPLYPAVNTMHTPAAAAAMAVSVMSAAMVLLGPGRALSVVEDGQDGQDGQVLAYASPGVKVTAAHNRW